MDTQNAVKFVIVKLGDIEIVAGPKTFSSGSTGFYGVPNGKPVMEKAPALVAEVKAGDMALPPFMVPAKNFSTGSVGYYLGDKVTLPDGARYQMAISAVLIGSKANDAEAMAQNRYQVSVQFVKIGSKNA